MKNNDENKLVSTLVGAGIFGGTLLAGKGISLLFASLSVTGGAIALGAMALVYVAVRAITDKKN